jgi:hypothetical protein
MVDEVQGIIYPGSERDPDSDKAFLNSELMPLLEVQFDNRGRVHTHERPARRCKGDARNARALNARVGLNP